MRKPNQKISRTIAEPTAGTIQIERQLWVRAPVEVDVTLLSIADRLATRGDRAQESIEAHMTLATGVLGDALEWHVHGPPRPLLRGDELASDLGIPTGPRVGELLEAIAAARYAGELGTREGALAYARELMEGRDT